MSSYRLTKEADSDIEGIIEYTIQQWGEKQAKVYLDKISVCLKNIGKKEITSKPLSKKYPQVKVIRCEHHYIFYLPPQGKKKAIILAVLHEQMDMLSRLKDRLG